MAKSNQSIAHIAEGLLDLLDRLRVPSRPIPRESQPARADPKEVQSVRIVRVLHHPTSSCQHIERDPPDRAFRTITRDGGHRGQSDDEASDARVIKCGQQVPSGGGA